MKEIVTKIKGLGLNLIRVGVNEKDKNIYECSVYAEHEADLITMDISWDGKYIVTTSDDGTVKVWDVNSWSLVEMYKIERDVVEAICMSPDFKYIVGNTLGTLEKGRIYRWERGTGVSEIYRGFNGGVRDVAVALGGSYIFGCGISSDSRKLSSYYDHTIRIWR